MNKFQIGDQVKCVNALWAQPYPDLIRPLKNNIYTIREIDGDSCLLMEIHNKPVADHDGTIVYDPKGSEPAFYLWHFEKYDNDATAAVLNAIQKLLEEGRTDLFPSGKYLQN